MGLPEVGRNDETGK